MSVRHSSVLFCNAVLYFFSISSKACLYLLIFLFNSSSNFLFNSNSKSPFSLDTLITLFWSVELRFDKFSISFCFSVIDLVKSYILVSKLDVIRIWEFNSSLFFEIISLYEFSILSEFEFKARISFFNLLISLL